MITHHGFSPLNVVGEYRAADCGAVIFVEWCETEYVRSSDCSRDWERVDCADCLTQLIEEREGELSELRERLASAKKGGAK